VILPVAVMDVAATVPPDKFVAVVAVAALPEQELDVAALPEQLLDVAALPVQDPDEPEQLPVRLAVIVPAEKFPLASLRTIMLAVLAFVAPCSAPVTAAIWLVAFVAVAALPEHELAVAALPEQLLDVAALPVQDPDEPEQFPVRLAVIVPAEKFPLASLRTIMLAVLAFVAPCSAPVTAAIWLVAFVAVAALPVQDPDEPEQLPVTFPVSGPENPAAARTPVNALYDSAVTVVLTLATWALPAAATITGYSTVVSVSSVADIPDPTPSMARAVSADRTSGDPVSVVCRPKNDPVAISAIFPSVTALLAIVCAPSPDDVTSPE